jgi:hypothetical protein
MNITPNFDDKKINSGKIKFKVTKFWITDNKLQPENIILYKLSGSQWAPLPTSQVSFDGNTYKFEATTTGFSTYAIAGTTEQVQTQPTTPPQAPSQPTAPPSAPSTPSQPAQQTPKSISILYPNNNAAIEGSTIEVQLSETGVSLVQPGGTPTETQGHFHVYLDGQQEQSGTVSHYVFFNVAEGTHTITAELQRNDHTSFSPQVLKSITVTVSGQASVSTAASNDVYVYLAILAIIIIAVLYKLMTKKKHKTKHSG